MGNLQYSPIAPDFACLSPVSRQFAFQHRLQENVMLAGANITCPDDCGLPVSCGRSPLLPGLSSLPFSSTLLSISSFASACKRSEAVGTLSS